MRSQWESLPKINPKSPELPIRVSHLTAGLLFLLHGVLAISKDAMQP